jgi:hypothetical protein
MERPEVINRHGLQLELLHRRKPSRARSHFHVCSDIICARIRQGRFALITNLTFSSCNRQLFLSQRKIACQCTTG